MSAMSNAEADVSQAWQKAIAHVLASEGGLVDHAADPGGITNFGISLRFLKDAGIDIDHDGDIDADDIRKLTIDSARTVYYDRFWLPNGYGQYPEQVAIKLFDMAVNMGPSQAHKLLQKALWGHGHKLEIDGKLGPATIQAVQAACFQSASGAELMPSIRLAQHCFYDGLVAAKPALAVFQKGWINRAYSC